MFVLNLEYFGNKKNQDFLIKVIKIIIIGFVSFSLLASAIPFYLGFDDVSFGNASINLSKGNASITNELLQEMGLKMFVPTSHVITSDKKSAVPVFTVGIYSIGALSYLLGGFYGLFYFGPIVTIILLIFYERIASKFFGNLVGLLALLLLVADWQVFFVGLRFLTDNIFTLFFILGVFGILKFLQKKDDRYILLCSTFFVISTLFRINGIVFFFTEIIIISTFFIFQYLKESKIFIKQKDVNSSGIFLQKQLFSKSNYKKFFKLSFFLLIPWLIFFSFWFSYNDYYFGDTLTNYREQIRSGSIDSEDTDIEKSFLPIPIADDEIRNEFERIKLVQYFSVPLIPDPLYFFLIVTSDTDLDAWRSDIWISYITLSLLSIALIISLYFKIKIKEVLTLLFFIIAVVGFYSSPIVSGSPVALNLDQANNRYMIPATSLSFILIGFVLVELWSKLSSNQPELNKKLKSLKLIYLLFILVFFLALITIMPSIQDMYQRGFHFNNPILYANSFEELEKLPEKSLIVGYSGSIGRYTLLHTDTKLSPYSKNFIRENGDPDSISQFKLKTLKTIIGDGYTAYTFKTNIFSFDAKYFKILEAQHGIILKDYSKTFCKMELISNSEENVDNYSSDPICFQDIVEKRQKLWPVSLKWPH